MIPVWQTRTGLPSGNCTEAAFASLLNLPLADVPDLYYPDLWVEVERLRTDAPWRAPAFERQYWYHRWLSIHNWLASLGKIMVRIDVPDGSTMTELFGDPTFTSRLPPLWHYGFCMVGVRLQATETGERVGHWLVACNGKVKHDPAGRDLAAYEHDLAGQLLIEELVWLRPTSDFEDEYECGVEYKWRGPDTVLMPVNPDT